MRELAFSTMFHAANACKWDDEQKMCVYCSHIATIIPGGDFDKIFTASKAWSLDSGIPIELVLHGLAHIVDQSEAASDYRGECFKDYAKSLVEAWRANKTDDEKKEPAAPKVKPGRKAKGATTTAKPNAPKKASKGASAKATGRSKAAAGDEADSGPVQKFPAGTVATPAVNPPEIRQVPTEQRDIDHQPQVTATPPKIFLVGYLEKAFYEVSKQLLSVDAPVEGQRLGALIARQKFDLPDNMELVLELLNGRPKPGVDVFLRKDRKTVAQLPQAIRKHTRRYAIVYNDTEYVVRASDDE